MNKISNETHALLAAAVKAIDDKFGVDPVVLDISGISSMADYFIITNGSNPNQIKAIADAVEEAMYKKGAKLNHSEGYQNSTWVLLDFSDIIVHIFNKEDRAFYNLERVWGDAQIVDVGLKK